MTFDQVLVYLKTTQDEAFPKKYYFSQKIRLTRPEIRSMIGKWTPSKECPITIREVVDDIIQNIKSGKQGIYYYGKKIDIFGMAAYRYELVIQEDEIYFCDKLRQKYYTFITNYDKIF